MPDRDLSARARMRVRWLRAVMYAAVAGAGLAALVWTPGIVAVPVWVTATWAVPTAISGVVSCAGVIVDRYRIEWAGANLSAGGVAACATIAFQAVGAGRTGLTALACALTGLAIALALRAVELRERARRLRDVS